MGVVATGGTITYSGGKTIHTFTSSGDFIVTGAGDLEYLVVAGGGGGASGGGGAGGSGIVILSYDTPPEGGFIFTSY